MHSQVCLRPRSTPQPGALASPRPARLRSFQLRPGLRSPEAGQGRREAGGLHSPGLALRRAVLPQSVGAGQAVSQGHGGWRTGSGLGVSGGSGSTSKPQRETGRGQGDGHTCRCGGTGISPGAERMFFSIIDFLQQNLQQRRDDYFPNSHSGMSVMRVGFPRFSWRSPGFDFHIFIFTPSGFLVWDL